MARTTKAAKATKKSAKKKSTAKKGAVAEKGAAKKRAAKKRTTKKPPATKKSPATKKTASKRTVSESSASKNEKKSPARKKAPTKKQAAKKKVPAKKTPAKRKVKSPFDSRFLEQMRKLLNAERDVYERQAKQLRAEADSLVADMDPGDVQFDEESGEGDTIAVERGRDLALASKALEMIDEIDHALAKFDLGTYGICEISGEPIPKERLEAIPWAREKVEYKVGGFGRR